MFDELQWHIFFWVQRAFVHVFVLMSVRSFKTYFTKIKKTCFPFLSLGYFLLGWFSLFCKVAAFASTFSSTPLMFTLYVTKHKHVLHTNNNIRSHYVKTKHKKKIKWIKYKLMIRYIPITGWNIKFFLPN